MTMIIYKTTNLVNNKIYIGKQIRPNKNYLGSGLILKEAIKKYGRQNFKKEILETCNDKKTLSEREKYWISFYDSRNKEIGYNITAGGDGGSTNNHWVNKKHTDDSKLLISKNHSDVSGANNPMFGRQHKDETKKKISETRISLNIKHTNETKSKMSEKKRGENNNKSKLTESIVKAIRYDYFHNHIKQTDLVKKYNTHKNCIWKIVNYYTWSHID